MSNIGQKYLGTPGNWIPITDEECRKVLGKPEPVASSSLTIGKIVRYSSNGNVRIGKVCGADKAGLIFIAPVCNQSRSGYQFSTLQDKVLKSDIIGQVQTTL